jgi:C-mannosyltransferase DPY19L
MQERAKNYVIEDFLESNRITMKDLSDPKTEKKIQENLELLEQCNYDYELYKMEKKSMKTDTKLEKENFLNDIKKLKNQIQKVEKTQKVDKNRKNDKSQLEKAEEKEPETSEETEEELLKDTKPSDEKSKPKDTKKEQQTSSDVSIYNIQPYYTFALLQTFTVFFVALKFVVTPFFCLISATLPSKSWFNRKSSVYWVFYMFLVLCTFNYPGFKNLKAQFQQKNEFRNPELEHLIHWIDKTEPNAVFGAPIEVAAHILLTTKRPVVNHPLIEYPDMIDRTKSLYSIFSKRLSTEIYNNLVKLRVQYVVVSYDSCFLGSSEGVRLIDIFDYLDPDNYEKKAFCVSLFQNNNPTFLKVFENVKYIVIQIFSQSIQLELKKKSVLELNM